MSMSILMQTLKGRQDFLDSTTTSYDISNVGGSYKFSS